MRGAYYNENDRHKAAWLRNLIEAGAIAAGVVDERPIQEVQPDDVAPFAQAHFFAGIGVWSLALRRAGWPDDEPVWTGSCPCAPFSVAGKQGGFDDDRHLWPQWLRLLRQRRPRRILGEQVAAAGAWLDLVSADLEGLGYAFGAADLPAAGFAGAHIRQRFYWVADADNAQWWAGLAPWNDGCWPQAGRLEGDGHITASGRVRRLVDPSGAGVRGEPGRVGGAQREDRGLPLQGVLGHPVDGADPAGWLGEPGEPGLSDAEFGIVRRSGRWPSGRATEQSGDPSGTRVDWLFCRDRRWRPVEPGACPLVDEAPGRMGRLRGYGDALDAETATEFVVAFMAASPANDNFPIRNAA